MEEKKLYSFGAWSAFIMALMLIVNGITTFVLFDWGFWISRLCIVLSGFGVLPAIWRQLKEHAPGWVTWLTAIAYLGLATEGLVYAAQAQLSSNWLLFGGLGAWAIGMNLIGILNRRWPLWLCILGILGGVLLITAVVANTVKPGSPVNLLSAGLGAVVLYPAWLVWIGIRMLKE